jgi:hypothetical protein
MRGLYTLQIEEMMISEAMAAEAREMPGITVLSKPGPMSFDKKGNLNSDLPGH